MIKKEDVDKLPTFGDFLKSLNLHENDISDQTDMKDKVKDKQEQVKEANEVADRVFKEFGIKEK